MSEMDQSEFELYMSLNEFEDGPIAVLGMRWQEPHITKLELESERLGHFNLDPSHLPERTQPCGGRYHATLTISSEPQATGHEIGDLTSRLSFKAETHSTDENSRSVSLYDTATGEREGNAFFTTYPLPDDWSFPVLSDREAAYITLELEYDLGWDRSTFSPLELRDMWGYLDRTTPGVLPEWSVEMESEVVSPVSDGERVYVKCSDGSVSAFLAADGTISWTFDVDTISTKASKMSRPVVADGSVYFEFGGDCYALDAATGTVEWRTGNVGGGSNPQLLADIETVGQTGDQVNQTLYVSGSEGLSALDPATGALQWSFDPEERITDLRVSDGHAFATTHEKDLYGVDAQTGEQVWKFDFDGRVLSGPVADGGLVFFGTDESTPEGRPVYALDIETGEPVWQIPFENRSGTICGVDEDQLYVYHQEDMHVLDAETGSSQHTMSVPGFGKTVDGSLFCWSGSGSASATPTVVSKIDKSTGHAVQRYGVPSERKSSMRLFPGFHDDVVYVSVNDSKNKRYWMTAVRFTDATQLPFEGTVRSLGGEESTAILSLDGAEDESLILSQTCLPEYGRFEDARYELVVSMDIDESAVATDRHYESDQVTVFAVEVIDVDGEQAILDLTALDRDGATGTLRLDAERLPTDLSTVGDTGFVGIYHMLDEEATPDDAKPDEWD